VLQRRRDEKRRGDLETRRSKRRLFSQYPQSPSPSLCADLKTQGINIAVVISDRTMPEMSGDEFLIKFHAAYPKTLKILLTGQADVDSLGNILNAAALYRYIAKPWDETDFILTVKEALRRYEQEEQLSEQNALLKQTNQRLSKSLNLLLAAFEAADDGILVSPISRHS
jgi:response regulator RpfG family c-di-GMP phosphodiesterase